MLYLIYYLVKQYNTLNKTVIIALSMIIGGGCGNLIDRIYRGYVIDYIDISYFFRYPIFNFADIFIVIGIIIIIGFLVIKNIKEQENS